MKHIERDVHSLSEDELDEAIESFYEKAVEDGLIDVKLSVKMSVSEDGSISKEKKKVLFRTLQCILNGHTETLKYL